MYTPMCRVFAIVILLGCVSATDVLRAAESSTGADVAAALEKVLVDAIAHAEKSVVAIARVRKQQPGEIPQVDQRPDPFGRRPAPLVAPQPTDPDFIPNEYATGVVVDPRGLILTAYHTLGQDSDYYVTTAERNVYKATIKGADPRSDLAVLAIEGTGKFSPIALGDAGAIRKGQIIISLGNPYAIARDGQVCAAWGIVSNLARKAPATPSDADPSGRSTLHHYGTLIQTDAKLNRGVSGGPLLNLKGEMVGLCVAISAAAGYESAAGYAYPVDAAFRRALETLKQGREVDYGFLGVLPTNLQAAARPGSPRGVRVSQVVPGSPAAQAGLKVDDTVVAVDQMPIFDADRFYLEVGRLPAEAVSHLDVVRDGRQRTVDVTLAKYPVRGKKIVTNPDPAWRGLRVDFPSALVEADGRSPGNLSLTGDAVVVTEVAEDSPAWRAGLRHGMLIGQAAGKAVHTPQEFATAVAHKSGPVELRVSGARDRSLYTVQPGG